MSDIELRNPELISNQMYLVRVGDASIDKWSVKDITADLLSLSIAMQKDLQKVIDKKHGYKSAAKRIRSYTKAIETLGIKFRVKSMDY